MTKHVLSLIIFALFPLLSLAQTNYFEDTWDRFLDNHMFLSSYHKGFDSQGYSIYGFPITKDSLNTAANNSELCFYETLYSKAKGCMILRFTYLVPSYRILSKDNSAYLHIGTNAYLINKGLVSIQYYGYYSSVSVDLMDVCSLDLIPKLDPNSDYYLRLVGSADEELILPMDREVSFHVLLDFSDSSKKVMLNSLIHKG